MVSKNKKVLAPMVVPMLQERLRMMDAHGADWDDKPRDMLQWLLEEARAKGTPFDNVVEKVLLVNFGAIHTSSGVRCFVSCLLFRFLCFMKCPLVCGDAVADGRCGMV